METHFGRAARSLPLTHRQYEIVVGSLLGDATLAKTTSGFCFRVHHGIAQRELVDWKYDQLREFVRTPPRISGHGCYFRTVTHPAFSEMATAFYRQGRKVIPGAIIGEYLTALTMAVWIMDDGAADGRQLRLNTQCFSDDDVQLLAALVSRTFGFTVTINRDKGKPRLRFAQASMPILTQSVIAHILPSMRYKFAAWNALAVGCGHDAM